MPKLVRIVAASLCLAMVGLATADFAGPAPVAWRWAQPTSIAPGGPPVVSGDVIYNAVGRRLYAIERSSGNQLWRFPVADPLEANFREGALLVGDTLMAAADNKLIYAVDARTGESKWQFAAPQPIIGPLVTAGNFVVFAMADSSLMAINPADGTAAWENPQRVFEGVMGDIATYQGSLLFFTQGFELVSIDVSTKRVNWRTRFSVLGPTARPVVFGDTIYVSSGAFLTAVNAGTGRGIPGGQANLGTQIGTNPSVNENGVAVVSQEGKVFTFDLRLRPQVGSANLVRRGGTPPVDLESVAVVDPLMIGDLVAVATSSGSVQLINVTTGDLVWNYIVRPIATAESAAPAGPMGGPGGPGGIGGPPFGGSGPTNQADTAPKYVTAAAAPILAGETLLLSARDGSLLAFDSTTGVDLTAPVIELLYPNAGDQISGRPPLGFFFEVTDEASGLNYKSLEVTLDGNKLEAKANRDGLITVLITEEGPNRPLTDGRRELTVKIADWMGNVATRSFAVTVDNTLRPIGLPQSQPNQPGGPGRGPGAGPGLDF